MEQKYVKDYVRDDFVEGFFAVRRKDVREYARGQFVSLELGDHTGRINGVMWEPDQFALTEMTEGMVVKARAVVGEYNHRPQLNISRIRLANEDEYALEDILPHSTQPREQRESRLMALTAKIENGYIKALTEAFWTDRAFFDSYMIAAAGKLWHHAYIGGLSEHSANVTELALRVAQGYPWLNKDYLIFGGLFHDAGKVRTYSSDSTVIDYTDEGRLIGHICLADHWIAEKAAVIEGFPSALLMKLRHMILSHQGELQYATPVVPQMPEAFVLYYCDEIDSKMGAIERIRTRQGGTGWSEYVNMLDRFLYFGDGPEEPST
ncbi:MAG: OB-fold nucleic acid binding domain-containing protein [candidate division Zixibacteria bacterium]|jgi:3'-5' exoribonuclease|nr:OB-fold nucleic acid binding domain-containing protein [candidate division Zixibacteria bacterium]